MSKNPLHSVFNNSNLKENKQNTSAFNLFDVMTCTLQVRNWCINDIMYPLFVVDLYCIEMQSFKSDSNISINNITK